MCCAQVVALDLTGIKEVKVELEPTWWGHWLCSSSPETEGRKNGKKNHVSDRPLGSAPEERAGSQACTAAAIESGKC